MLEEVLHRLHLPLRAPPDQRRQPLLVLGLDVGLLGDKVLHDTEVALHGGEDEGGAAPHVPLLEVGANGEEELADGPVPLPRRRVQRCSLLKYNKVYIQKGQMGFKTYDRLTPSFLDKLN